MPDLAGATADNVAEIEVTGRVFHVQKGKTLTAYQVQ